MREKLLCHLKRAQRFGYWLYDQVADGALYLDRNRAEFRKLSKDARRRQLGGDISGALAVWEDIRVRRPKEAVAYCNIAICARNIGQLHRAIEVIDEAIILFPNNRKVIAEAAQNAQARGDWAGSVTLWERIIHRPGLPPIWLHMHAHALLVIGDFDGLSQALARYKSAYPERSGPLSLEAMFASSRGDWSLAVELWHNFRQRFPNEKVGWEHYGRALQELEFHRLANGDRMNDVGIMEQAQVDVIEHGETRELLLGFEGLGSDCEFGLVQRRFAAEPLSLLRFNAVTYSGLMLGLVNRFEGMGAEETTEMITLGNGEYFVRDRRWGLGMHTFNFVGQIDAEVLYRKFCQRVEFLKRKLLQDLSEASKIFVFYAPGQSLNDIEMLHAALQELGPVTLLHVTTLEVAGQAEPGLRGGDIVKRASGLYVGYLSRAGRELSGAWNIEYNDWISICSKTRMAVDEA